MSLGKDTPPSGAPPVPLADMRKIAAAAVLLAVPVVALLWVSSYVEEDPKLFGFPLFFWYQLLWVLLCSAVTWAAYRLTLSAHEPRVRPRPQRHRRPLA